MGKKILDSKALYIFLSVIIAVALWVYVTSQDGYEETKTISNIPITFSGVESLEARGLMIVGDTPTGSVRVSAAPSVLNKLTRDTVKLTVNVSQLEEAAEYTLAYTASLPADVRSDQAEFLVGTGNVSFTVDRYATRNVEVRGIFTGTVADGYLPGAASEFIFAPETLTISGQSELIKQVAYVLVTVDGKELTNSVSGEYSYQFIGASGDVLEGLDIECESDTVYVTYPIRATAEVELAVKLIAGGGASENLVNYTLSTERITVAGSTEAVAAIAGESLTIATIDLAEVHDGDQITCAIPLTDELTNISGITEVTITIELSSTLKSKFVNATKIECINVPDGWDAKVITQMLSVEIRGGAAYLDDVTEENIRIVADLSELTQNAGQHTVPVKIYLDSVGSVSQVGVVGTDYTAVVSLTKN